MDQDTAQMTADLDNLIDAADAYNLPAARAYFEGQKQLLAMAEPEAELEKQARSMYEVAVLYGIRLDLAACRREVKRAAREARQQA